MPPVHSEMASPPANGRLSRRGLVAPSDAEPQQCRLWFTEAFGFDELEEGHGKVAENFEYDESTGLLTSKANLKKYQAGKFTTPSVGDLRTSGSKEKLKAKFGAGAKLTVTSKQVDDIAKEMRDPQNCFSTFQAASQFNCLEHPSEAGMPESGINGYGDDATQGPACAVAAGPGTVVRSYFAIKNAQGKLEPQTKDKQVNTLGDAIEKAGIGGHLRVQNGYTIVGDISDLNEIASKLMLDNKKFLENLRVGIMHDTEILKCPRQLVTQVYVGSCSVTYNTIPKDQEELWEPLAVTLLEGAYEATLFAAVETALRHPDVESARTVFLIDVGGGVNGNKAEWITTARSRALAKFQDVPLTVVLCSASKALTADDVKFEEQACEKVKCSVTKQCENYKKALRLARLLLHPGVTSRYYFDSHQFDSCFCGTCIQKRDNGRTSFRRAGEDYYLPCGYVKVALPVDEQWEKAMQCFDTWPVFFHPILNPAMVPHILECAMVYHARDRGPFGEPCGRGSTTGNEIHFMRSMRFGEEDASHQGYGTELYRDLGVGLQVRVSPAKGGVTEVAKAKRGGSAFDKLVTKRRLAHVITGLVVRIPNTDDEFWRVAAEWAAVGSCFKQYLEQVEELARATPPQDIVSVTMSRDLTPFPRHTYNGISIQFLPRSPVVQDEELPHETLPLPLPKSSCHVFKLAEKFVIKEMGLSGFLLENRYCWCTTCCGSAQPRVAAVGCPPRRYQTPLGWCEFPVTYTLRTARGEYYSKQWHVAFHGSKGGAGALAKVVGRGCALLKAGDTTFDGQELKIVEGHCTKPFERKNKYYTRDELFDPTCQFFSSPLWKYCDCRSYRGEQATFAGKKVTVLLKLRLRPGSYSVGQETMGGAAYMGSDWTANGWLDRVEYYSDRFSSHIVESVLVRVE